MRSDGRGAQNLEAPQYPIFYKWVIVAFHVKHKAGGKCSSVSSPPSGNVVKLRICVSRYDSASYDRFLKFLRVLRLLRFSECANNR